MSQSGERRKGKNNAPLEAQGKRQGDARDSLSVRRAGFTAELTEVGTLSGELYRVKARNYCVWELWELLDRI